MGNPEPAKVRGIFHDSEGAFILYFSDPVGLCSLNRAKTEALQVRLHDAHSSNLSSTLVEEIWGGPRWVFQELLGPLHVWPRLGPVFVHVKTSANLVAVVLAKKAVALLYWCLIMVCLHYWLHFVLGGVLAAFFYTSLLLMHCYE